MKPEVKAAWVKALTDGSYEKRETDLRFDDKYCVLGVLCDLYAKEHPEAHWERRSNGVHVFYLSAEDAAGNMQEPPMQVAEWAGLESHRGNIPWDSIPKVAEELKAVSIEDGEMEFWTEGHLRSMTTSGLSLMRLNDGGVGFPCLARVIDAVF